VKKKKAKVLTLRALVLRALMLKLLMKKMQLRRRNNKLPWKLLPNKLLLNKNLESKDLRDKNLSVREATSQNRLRKSWDVCCLIGLIAVKEHCNGSGFVIVQGMLGMRIGLDKKIGRWL
jgi:hypothetical protein